MKVGRINYIMSIIFMLITCGLLITACFIKNSELSLALIITAIASFSLVYHYINAVEIDKLRARINVLEKIYD